MPSDLDEETVEIPAWAAIEARHELERAIKHTGGGETGAAAANTPLAEVWDRITTTANQREYFDEKTLGAVNGIIQAVAEDRHVDISGADPLIDQTFQAKDAIESALIGEMDGDDVPLAFHDRFLSPILSGEKTKTIRYDFGAVDPGDTLVMRVEDRPVFGRAPVKAVWEMTAETLVHQEVTLLEDGHRDYDDVDELLECLSEFYPDAPLGPKSQLTIIQWGDVEEEVDDV